jgi:hypothetical protein
VGETLGVGLGTVTACIMRFEDPTGCQGPLQLHHAIKQQTLRKHGHHDLLYDHRNLITVCERHHRRHHNRTQPIPYAALPAAAIYFAHEIALHYQLERYYPAHTGPERSA